MKAAIASRRPWRDVFLAFLKLGFTSFGGPVAHIGFFRAEFVARRGWVDEATYADVVALCQFLPGPASSQVGMSLGLLRAGLPGALAAWLGFTLPSAVALIVFGTVIHQAEPRHAAWLHGLKVVAVAVVAQAVWSMARTLCPDRARVTLAAAACVLASTAPSALGQIGAIAMGGLLGWRLLAADPVGHDARLPVRLTRSVAVAALLAFFALLVGLPLLAGMTGNHAAALVASFYRSGALVFGGGHVVLPLLQKAVVPTGWVSNDLFLAGYGAAQAVPGPLFTFAAYLGAVMRPPLTGWTGGAICLVAIFLPSFLLLVGVLPFWAQLRRRAPIRAALKGVNAAVVGLLLAALYTPVWTSGITDAGDFCGLLAAFVLLVFWRTPPWLVVLGGAAAYALTGGL